MHRSSFSLASPLARRFAILFFALFALCGACFAQGRDTNFGTATFDFQSFSPYNAVSVYPWAIDSAGQITGYYYSAKNAYGFLREPGGQIITIMPPGAIWATARGSTPDGLVFGSFVYPDEGGNNRGFVRDSAGNYTIIETVYDAIETYPNAINIHGQIVGSVDGYGFLRNIDGSFVLFSDSASDNLTPISINSSGEVTGFYYDDTGNPHGFLRSPDGLIQNFDVPESANTEPWAINDSGDVVGTYIDQARVQHGFLRKQGGIYFTVDPPGSSLSTVTNIGPDGIAVGYFSDPNTGAYHGFLRLTDGSFVSIDDPGAASTIPYAINDADEIVGNESTLTGYGVPYVGFLTRYIQ